MEPLRLLQFWHIPSDKNPAAVRDSPTDTTFTSFESTTTTTNDKEDRHAVEETDDEDSFFDLDFTVPLKKNLSKRDDLLPRKALPNPHSPPPKLRLHMLLNNPDADEEVRIFSVLNSTIGTSPASKLQKQRRFPKVVIQKYLKLINPFYSRVSKKTYTDRTDEVWKTTPFSSPRKQVQPEKQGSRVGAACNHLGKSRSASSAVRAAPARRDDSLLLQDDGIQSAILHCKRSYNSSSEFYVLSRSARSDHSEEVSGNPRRNSCTEEVKTRNSI